MERNRKSLVELFKDANFSQGAVDDLERNIESRLEGIRQSIEKDLLTDNAFTTWRDKPEGKGKDEIPWGVEV